MLAGKGALRGVAVVAVVYEVKSGGRGPVQGGDRRGLGRVILSRGASWPRRGSAPPRSWGLRGCGPAGRLSDVVRGQGVASGLLSTALASANLQPPPQGRKEESPRGRSDGERGSNDRHEAFTALETLEDGDGGDLVEVARLYLGAPQLPCVTAEPK